MWESSKYGAAQCYARYDGGCEGAYNNHCSPHVIWGGITSSGTPYSAHFNYGRLDSSVDYTIAWSFSVRCVLDLKLLLSADCQLCEYHESSKYGAAQCGPFYGGCQGAAPGTSWANNCYPYGIWSSALSETGYYYNRELNAGSFANALIRPAVASFGVRCVLVLKQILQSCYF